MLGTSPKFTNLKLGGVAAALLLGLTLLSIALSGNAMAQADDYPNRTVRVIVPNPPGGGVDAFARTVAQYMTKEFGQSFVVENHAGGDGVIGTQLAATAEPDGYTLYVGSHAPLAIMPHLNPDNPYQTLEVLEPISQIAASSAILVVHPSVPANTFEEFIALAKSEPGKLNYATSSSATYMATELLKLEAGIDLFHIPYKGTGPAMTDILAGHVDVMFGGALATVPYVQSGKLKGLAVAGKKRSHVVSDIPTIAESGYPNFSAETWHGMFAPKGTPKPIIDKLYAAVVKAMSDDAIAKPILDDGAEPTTSESPEAFRAFVQAENEKWKKVIDASGIKPDK